MQKIIIKTGRTYPALAEQLGDFEQWIERELGAAPGEWRVVDVQRGEALPPVADCRGAVLTGSPAMVSDYEDWSVSTAAWLREAVQDPFQQLSDNQASNGNFPRHTRNIRLNPTQTIFIII